MDLLNSWREFLAGMNPRQRFVLLVSAGAVVVVLAGFVNLIGRPGYHAVSSGLAESDAREIAGRLASGQIPYQLTAGGTAVSVPAARLDEARLLIASQGVPRSGRLGFELFDEPSWGSSGFQEKVNYQRALEGELERTIGTLDEVETARVHIVMPRDSIFTEKRRAGKASVVLQTRRGRLSEASVRAIANLVAGAVEGIDPESVAILSTENSAPGPTLGRAAPAPSDSASADNPLLAWFQNRPAAARYLALAVLFLAVYLLLLRPIKAQAVEAFRQLPRSSDLAAETEDGAGEPLPQGAEAGRFGGRPAAEISGELAGDDANRAAAVAPSARMEVAAEAEASSALATVRAAGAGEIAAALKEELPQTFALVLAHLDSGKAAGVLSRLPKSARAAIVRRLAATAKFSPVAVAGVFETLANSVQPGRAERNQNFPGIRAAAGVLSAFDADAREGILVELATEAPQLAGSLRGESGSGGPGSASDGAAAQRERSHAG